jgi:hypothetical protein
VLRVTGLLCLTKFYILAGMSDVKGDDKLQDLELSGIVYCVNEI